MLLFTIVFLLHQLVNLLFRIFDEIIFFRYRQQKITNPVFIIANPRSGSTFLHHLLSLDNRYAYMKLAHTIFPSVSFAKLYRLVGFIDRKMGGTFSKLLNKSGKYLFRGWENIHPLGFTKAEEDEAIFTLALTSPAVFLLFPFLHKLKENWILDNEPEPVKKKMMNYYVNCIRRFMYANGHGKTYLSKNVLSSGRIHELMKRFPDARIIYLARNPYEALPSFISMFGVMYNVHSPWIKNNDDALKAWAWLGIAFYKHIFNALPVLSQKHLCLIKYDDLTLNPKATVQSIYGKLNLELSNDFELKLESENRKNKSYKSKHSYSLEKYSLTRDQVYHELQFVFAYFDFQA